MSLFINNISISNFKSILKADIKDCKRISLFIGQPNTGKSNILEALSIFSLPLLCETSRPVTDFIRLENETELFYNADIGQPVIIDIVTGYCKIDFNRAKGVWFELGTESANEVYSIDRRLKLKGRKDTSYILPQIRKYTFRANSFAENTHIDYLIPPFGINLFEIIETNKHLRKEIEELLKQHDLYLEKDNTAQSFKVIQSYDKNLFQLPFASISKTLQHVIFYKSVIASNKNAILLFDNPGDNLFPPYLTHFTEQLLNDKNNQYFLAINNPYLLNEFLDKRADEISIYSTSYKNNQTEIRELTEAELDDIWQNGVDLLTNNESYT